MHRTAIFIGSCVALVLLVLIISFARFDVGRYRGRVQSELEQQLNRKVILGDMRLRLLPLRLQVENPVIDEDPRFRGQSPFIKADTMDVSVALLPLALGNVEIDAIALQRPSVELVKNRQGVWNFSSLGVSSAGSSVEDKINIPKLGKIAIHDGQIAITNLQKGKPRTVYDHIDLTLGDFQSGKPFVVKAVVHVSPPGSQELQLQGRAGALSEGKNAYFKGTIRFKNVEIGGLRSFLDAPGPAITNGIVSGESTINAEKGRLDAVGALELDNVRINGRYVGDPVKVRYDLDGDLKRNLIKVSSATIDLKSMAFSVGGFIDVGPSPAELDLQVLSNRVALAEITPLASAFGLALPAGTTVTGRVNCDIRIRGTVTDPVPNGTIAGRDLRMIAKEIPQSVQVKSVDLAVTPREIRSNDFAIESGNTKLSTHFALTQYRSSSPAIDLSVRAVNASLPELRSIAKAYGAKWAEKVVGTGTLDLNLRASGSLRSIGSSEIIRLLNGTAYLNFNNVRISGIDAEHEVASIGGFLKSDDGNKGFTNIEHLTAHFVVNNGIARTNDLNAVLRMGKVAAGGTANLATEALNFRAVAVLSKTASHEVGGNLVSGYMRTVMSNKQGELVIPGTVTGTFQNPKFNPDMEQLTRMRMRGILPSYDNPAGIIGSLLGQQSESQSGQRTQKPSRGIEKTLRGILGGGKKK